MGTAQGGSQARSGTVKSGGAKSKGMKRCALCGAKNKASFEYCIRCSEPLVEGAAPERAEAPAGAPGVTKLFFTVLAALAVLVVGALAFRTLSSAPASPSASASSAPAAAADLTPPAAPSELDIDSQETLEKFNAGVAAFNQRDYSAAADLFQEIIRELPDNPAAHQYLGLAFFHQQQFPEAMNALAAARALRPDSLELLDHYVISAKKAGDLASGAAALRDYVQRHPDSIRPRLELSRIAREMGNASEALEQTEYLANASGASPEFQYEYGVSLKEAGKFDEAIAALKSSIELDPNSASAHHALGVTELMAGKPKEAVGALEQAVAKAPDNGDFRFSLAQAYEKLDRIPESLAAYEAYLERANESDSRAKVVRERLEVAKKALAEREKANEPR